MTKEMVEAVGTLTGLLIVLRWYIGWEIKRQWDRQFSTRNAQLQALKQRQALAQLAAVQAEQKLPPPLPPEPAS